MNRLSYDSVDPTGYLQEKKLSYELLASFIGLRRSQDWWYGDCLEYPLVNVKGQITGCERIFSRGLLHQRSPDRFDPKDNKKVIKGTRVSESFALVGASLAELPHYFGCLRIVGGMADAVNVYLASGEPVVCIVGENNARSIVSHLVERWPHLENNIVVALDHDLPGISACHRSGCRWVVPESFGEDWSDVRQRAGLQALKRQLQGTRRAISFVDLKELPAPAVDMAIASLENNYRKSLKCLSEAGNEQVAATLAKAIVVRFHNRVPARCSELDFLGRIQIANPYLLHPDVLSQLKSLLGRYCSQQRQTLQVASGLSLVKQKVLGNSYHLISEIKPETVPLEKDCITLIKAPYASGKTKLLTALSLAAAQSGQRVLAITHLVSLAHELSQRLGLESYLEIPEPFMSTVQRLVTCVNSLCAPNVDSFLKAGKLDILLLDEFTQHIGVLGTSPFIKDPSVLSRYLDLIEKTPTVVICDADLSSYHVDLLQQWFPERDIQFYEMPFPRESGLYCHFGAGKHQQKSVIENQLLPAIARGEHVAIALDNRKEALRLEKTIRRQLPDVALLELDGKNRNEPPQKAFLQSCNEEAEKYQVVIYTPAIQSGLSITAPFDQVFGFHYNQVLPTDFIQMLRRFRTIKQFTAVADLGVRATGNQDWLSCLQALEHTRRYTRNLDQIAITEYDGFCEREKIRQLKMNNLGANGLYYLMESRGFTMSYLESEKCSEGFDQTWKKTGKAIKELEADLLLKAARLTVEQYDQISHKLEPAFQELYSCERFRLCNELGITAEQLKENDVAFWQTIGLSRLRRFMLWPLSPQQGGGHYEPQPDPEQMPLCHRRFEQIGVQIYRQLLQPLFPDLDYSREWGKKEAEQVLDKVERYHKDVPFMLNQLKLIPDSVILNTPQGAKFKRPASACQFVGQLLRMAGLRTVSRQCRVDGGERARFYRVNPESLVIMQHYAHSRAAHKEIRVSQIPSEKIKICKSVTVNSCAAVSYYKVALPEIGVSKHRNQLNCFDKKKGATNEDSVCTHFPRPVGRNRGKNGFLDRRVRRPLLPVC